jgi:hypothetical protein
MVGENRYINDLDIIAKMIINNMNWINWYLDQWENEISINE